MVIQQMYTAYVESNKQPVGKITKDANESSERVLLAQTGKKEEAKSGRGRWKKRPTMEEYNALVSELAKAKNQLSQQKAFIDRLKASKANAAADQTSGSSGDKRKFEVEKGMKEKAKKAAAKPQKYPSLKPGTQGWKIMSPTGPISDSGSDQDEDSDDKVEVSKQKAKYARVSTDQINPKRERVCFATVKIQHVEETPEKDVTLDQPESPDGPMT
jgi:hypothetical protein